MLDWLRLWLNDDVPKTGHEYYDVATGKQFQITSVQNKHIEIRSAVDEDDYYTAPRGMFLKAYRLGIIRHRKDCYHCKNRR